MNLMRGKLLNEATINEINIFSLRLDGRLVSKAWRKRDLQNPNLQFKFRFSIQRRTMESTQLPERLLLKYIRLCCIKYHLVGI
jgi:hypothetical protein